MNIWKGVILLNAKIFCIIASALFAGTLVWCALQLPQSTAPFPEGNEKAGTRSGNLGLSTLAYVSNRVGDVLSPPVDPFRPAVEATFTNETDRLTFLRSLKASGAAKGAKASGSRLRNGGRGKKNPLAPLPARDTDTGQETNGVAMVCPRIRYEGFIERPDGSRSMMFRDSTTRASLFYELGEKVHGVQILDADLKRAVLRFPDNSSRAVELGGTLELPAEPAPPRAAGSQEAAQK